MTQFDIIENEVRKTMGFVPGSLHAMGKKPNILGSFVMLSANIRGFASSSATTWTGIKLMLKNMMWTAHAQRSTEHEVSAELKDLVSHVSSNAAGCRYCQAHTAHTAHRSGASVEKLQQVWEFHTSELFSAAEKAALNFAWAAGSTPNQVTPEHHEELQRHFTEEQIVEIVATIAIFGFLNRWNDSMATQIEDEPFEFATRHLSEHWEAGKHRADAT